ncbi:tetratricopeptide repeat protein [Chitinophagaceae bacterium LB-8]|uniref:Tetratricopeptide repeat protein n=1 Tax=Paraflavisolibacter caeni TaxID=2982496 RepID=A0A9X2XXC1_9BACT|nr:adenylate/guanylate cyclase domain-containing protein [Paraflavisolibacter caeni]MCU7551224.1 tetratricopeptide repeat protein [Paraflavisolibacter caeni]
MRQLAAILFADMTGYTALMQDNEQLARQKRRHMKEVLDTSVPQYGGKILQYYGDGTLTLFNSAIDGVNCAIQIQKLLQQEPKVDVRIGIHTGDVILEEESIYGDGVNLASRIESLGAPGSILVSEKVYDDIKNQEDILVREVGYFELKNVKQPVRIFAIANTGIVVPARHELEGKTKLPVNRLAVLPFVNMSADPDNEFFSDGITEELLNALTKVEGLQVTSRTSVFAFKGKNDDIRDIAIRLNVDKILEGSVRKAGNRVRITAQLINAADGYHIWSENYDRNLTDIFEVQDEISSIIANRLRENLLPTHKESHLVKAPTYNMEAYTLYLKGMHFWHKLTPADGRKAIEYFGQAIAIEPNYAQAYAMIANIYGYLGVSGQLKTPQAFEIVDNYSRKALEIDHSISEGHIARACLYLFYELKWEKAYEELQTALRLNPSAMEAYQLLWYYYIGIGKKDEAVTMMEKAIKLDPLSPILNIYLGEAYLYADRYDDAIRQTDKVLEMSPHMRVAIEIKGWANGLKGDWQKALHLFEEVHRLVNHPLKAVNILGFAYAKLGQSEKAMECIEKIHQRHAEEPDTVLDGDLGMIYWGLGDREKATYHFKNCIEKKLFTPIFYMQHPAMKGVENEDWYKELRKKAEV